MKIKKIISQSRRDFRAIYVCEHCNNEVDGNGYDDTFFHQEVIPSMECVSCHKKAGDNYRPLATKYADNEVV